VPCTSKDSWKRQPRCTGKNSGSAPESAEAHYRHANVLKDRRELEAAVAGYDRAIALRPDYAHAFCNRAVVAGSFRR
jgi:TPR repeat